MRNKNGKAILKQRMIKRLGEIISAELDKPDDQVDIALIDDCSACLAELLGESQISEAELVMQFDALMARIRTEEMPQATKQKHRPWRKAVAVLVAAVMTLISLTVVCFAVSAVRNWIIEVARMEPGTVIEVDGVTYVHKGKVVKYKSIAEFRAATGVDFKIPDALSEQAALSEIAILDDDQYGLRYCNDVSIIIMQNKDNTTSYDYSSIIVENQTVYLLEIVSPLGETLYEGIHITPQYIYTITAGSVADRDAAIKNVIGK